MITKKTTFTKTNSIFGETWISCTAQKYPYKVNARSVTEVLVEVCVKIQLRVGGRG